MRSTNASSTASGLIYTRCAGQHHSSVPVTACSISQRRANMYAIYLFSLLHPEFHPGQSLICCGQEAYTLSSFAHLQDLPQIVFGPEIVEKVASDSLA